MEAVTPDQSTKVGDGLLSIDDLAQQEGLPTSTIRMYVQQGLLHRPARRGRQAHYSTEHVRRLRSIRRLLDRGFSLTSIKELFQLQADGGELSSLLEEPLEPIDLQPSQFSALFSGGEIDLEVVRMALELGVLVMDRESVHFADRRHLQNALALAELGVDPKAALGVWKRTKEAIAGVVDDFAALSQSSGEEIDSELLARLVNLGLESVRLAYTVAVKSRTGGTP